MSIASSNELKVKKDKIEGPPDPMSVKPATPEEISRAHEAARRDGRVYGICGPGDWLGEAPVIDEEDVKQVIRKDVVVVGGGHSGLLATLGAVDEGASVAAIEIQPMDAFIKTTGKGAGPSGWYGGDIGHVNSKWLIEKGFGPYNTGEIVYEFCKRTLGHCDPDIIRQFVTKSGPMMDRMMEIYDSYRERRILEDGAVFLKRDILGRENVTVDFSEMTKSPQAITHCQCEGTEYPIVRGDYKSWPCNIQFYGHQGNNIEYFNKYILYYTQDHWAEWYYEHQAVVLEQNSEGDVTGVYAEDLNDAGKYILFRANKGVVVAAGDFKGDPKMCWALLNESMEWGERFGQTADSWHMTSTRSGTGHKMMCWAGAIMETTPRGAINQKFAPCGPWGTVPFLQLNTLGKRFYNEAAIPCATGIFNRQPEGKACYVTDKKAWDTVYKASLDHGAPNFGLPSMTETCRESFAAMEIGNPDGNKVFGMNLPGANRIPTTVYAADTLEELADMLGYEGAEKETFLAEIAHYNELCYSEMGDTDYGKDKDLMIPIDEAPFYGGKSRFSTKPSLGLATLAGVVADSEMRVARGGDKTKPIKGLYTCGNCLGNRYGQEYVSPMAGNSIGMAMTHGWIAGQNAAHGV